LKFEQTSIADLIVIQPDVYGDHRGYFSESWNQKRYEQHGLKETFVQDNLSLSQRGVLRGLHFQNPNGQGKLVSVLEGAVYDVAVDIRRGSPSFGKWFGIELTSENHLQLYVPPGFAHGFYVLSDRALFYYKCTKYYEPSSEHSILWSDQSIGIDWPTDTPGLSDKDAKALALDKFPIENLPVYEG